jgi:hypothetical protein
VAVSLGISVGAEVMLGEGVGVLVKEGPDPVAVGVGVAVRDNPVPDFVGVLETVTVPLDTTIFT